MTFTDVCIEIPHGEVTFVVTMRLSTCCMIIYTIWTFSFAKYTSSLTVYDELCVFFFLVIMF